MIIRNAIRHLRPNPTITPHEHVLFFPTDAHLTHRRTRASHSRLVGLTPRVPRNGGSSAAEIREPRQGS